MFGEPATARVERESHVPAEPRLSEFAIADHHKMVRIVEENGRRRVFGKRFAVYGVWRDGSEFLVCLHETAREAVELGMSLIEDRPKEELDDLMTAHLCELIVRGPFRDGEHLVQWVRTKCLNYRIRGMRKRLKRHKGFRCL